ncbi:MAG: tRNA-dihydrouridine synthase family protein [Bacteroidaceae bacterium]|nr:tRNA-dihydrouridine synthase family protein [Bacteroidales bacterium]MBR0272595.1 tRNA-dihydrouridine synthase family protein [Bacteroidaceae bacterium]
MFDGYVAFAPLQGYTDIVYRRAHWRHAGGVAEYFTPFVRLVAGGLSSRDARDVNAQANAAVPTVAQIIARDADEFARLCEMLQRHGWKHINLNLGCPFPMQVNAGRGCGLLQNPVRLEEIAQEMQRWPDVVFSVKMRCGQKSVDEGLAAMQIVGGMPLSQVVIHPRLGCQQYKGYVDINAFGRMADICPHPVVYNGDLKTTAQIEYIMSQFPKLKGVMVGRGLLERPWMLCGKEPLMVLHSIHEELYRHADATLCGDSQKLSRLKAFWEYIDIDRKHKKSIMKATTLYRYDQAVALALQAPYIS